MRGSPATEQSPSPSRQESLDQASLSWSILENKLQFPIFQVSDLTASGEPFSSLIHYPAVSVEWGMTPGKGTSGGWHANCKTPGSSGLGPSSSLPAGEHMTSLTSTLRYHSQKKQSQQFLRGRKYASSSPSPAGEACAVLTNSNAQTHFHLKHYYFACRASTKTSDESDICLPSISVLEMQLLCGFTPGIRSSQWSKSKGTEH